MDTKYGQLFTKDDLGEFVEALERLTERGDLALGTKPEQAIVDQVLDEMRGFKFPTNEPVFVLRGKDAAAIATLNAYRQECVRIGSPCEHIRGIDAALEGFVDWETDHVTGVPD